MAPSTLMANGFTTPFGWLPAENALKRPAPSFRRRPSARIERAVFPVHRKRTLQARSGMGDFLRTARSQVFDQWGADLGTAAAAILEQEGRDRAESLEISPIDDRAAAAFGPNQTRSA